MESVKMIPSSRVVFNTVIQYIRTIIFIVVSLFTTRLILDSLGVVDYGIYSIVGGIVSLLSFIQSSFSGATQRYLSYFQGHGDLGMQIKVFRNSVVTQILIGIVLLLILGLLEPFLFGGFLNIPEDRLNAASWVYWCMLCTLFFSLQAAPYLAMLIAHENILFTSIIQLFETLMKIPIAFSLVWFSFDNLKQYSLLIVLMQVVTFLFYYWYCKKKYPETKITRSIKFDVKLFTEMLNFVGWTIYSTGCIIGRTQGIAILLNRFFGATMNAAYGLALTISSQIGFISTSIQNSMNPQIVKAEGAGDRQKMLRLSEISSKFSFLLLALLAIPSVIEMDSLLSLWLLKVPDHTVLFCQFLIIGNLIDQATIGLTTANRALGNIRKYSIVIYSIKLLSLPAALVCLLLNLPVMFIMVCYVISELISVVIRLPILKLTGKLSISGYSKRVFLCILPPLLITTIACFSYSFWFNSKWSFLGTFILSTLLMLSTTYLFGLCDDEKLIIKNIFRKIIPEKS